MWAEVNGEKKKVACGPCIRGHRSSKCDHRDRVLVEVRKPGRPLSSCPHPTGSCSCERVVINYTIPKTSECACPSESSKPVLATTGAGRVQKARSRKSTATNFNPATLEKAIKVAQDGETDSSSHLTRTPTSESNNASNPSSASSTPRLLPIKKDTDFVVAEVSISTSRPATSHSRNPSSCCQPKPVQAQTKSCCSSKAAPPPEFEPPRKSCCGGSASAQPSQPQMSPPPMPSSYQQNLPNFPQYQTPFQQTPFSMAHPGSNFMQPPPYNFNTPIYNHLAADFQPLPMPPMNSHIPHHTPEHNCHCGDSCNCFGCAAHPNNATMLEYVRSMHQFMSTGQFGTMPPPTYDIPSYPHQAGYGAEANMGFTSFLPPGQMSFQTGMIGSMNMPQATMNVQNQWSQSSTVSTHNAQPPDPFFTPNPPPNASTTPKPTPTSDHPVTSPTPSSPDDTLSPSTFFWQEMVLPGCDDATGTCQCGDGCECVGCLTHGGHNGVPLAMPDGGGSEDKVFGSGTAAAAAGEKREREGEGEEENAVT